eukprot:SAG31_NODE_6870_length_1865_cov_2.010193_2_plen_141_part_00
MCTHTQPPPYGNSEAAHTCTHTHHSHTVSCPPLAKFSSCTLYNRPPRPCRFVPGFRGDYQHYIIVFIYPRTAESIKFNKISKLPAGHGPARPPSSAPAGAQADARRRPARGASPRGESYGHRYPPPPAWLPGGGRYHGTD